MVERKVVPEWLAGAARAQGGLIGVPQCEAAGLGNDVRRRLVASGEWKRIARGVFDTSMVNPQLHELDNRRLATAWKGLLAVRGSAAVSIAALVLHQVKGLPQTFDPEVAVFGGTYRRHRDGVVVRQFDLGMSPVRIGTARVAPADWALAQALPLFDRVTAVAVMDSMLYQGILDDAGIELARQRAAGRRGMGARHAWFDERDGRSESRPETEARLICADAGIPPDDLQRDVFSDDGEFLGRGDLLWHLGGRRRLVVEIDGVRYHQGADTMRRDNARQNRMIGDGGITMLRYFPHELRDPALFPAQIAAVLRAEGRHPTT